MEGVSISGVKREWRTDDGSVVLYQGDCLEILPQLEAGIVDAVITDPQYGISAVGGNFTRTKGKGTRRFDFFAGDNDHAVVLGNVETALREAIRVSSPFASHYVFCGHRQFGKLCDLYEAAGHKTRFVVWSKTCPAPSPPGSGWPAGAELCVYAFPRGRTWTPVPGEPPFSNVLTYDSYRHGQPGKVGHPTQKPAGLIGDLVRYSTSENDLVADWFFGSGTTAVACVRAGRRFIGTEKEPAYFDIAVARVAEELKRVRFLAPAAITQRSLLEDA
jgi:site-specific DNA-methyltransferase (adenine-specific)